jgi:hypothetical protein
MTSQKQDQEKSDFCLQCTYITSDVHMEVPMELRVTRTIQYCIESWRHSNVYCRSHIWHSWPAIFKPNRALIFWSFILLIILNLLNLRVVFRQTVCMYYQCLSQCTIGLSQWFKSIVAELFLLYKSVILILFGTSYFSIEYTHLNVIVYQFNYTMSTSVRDIWAPAIRRRRLGARV